MYLFGMDLCERCFKSYPRGVMKYERWCSDYCKCVSTQRRKQLEEKWRLKYNANVRNSDLLI